MSPFVNVLWPSATVQYGVTNLTANLTNYLNSTWRFGRRFTVGGAALDIDRLRIFAPTAATYRVTVHRQSDSASMATSDIVVASGEVNGWKEASITPVTLAASTEYVVSARAVGVSVNVYRDPTAITYNAAHTHDVYRYAGAVDTIPTTTVSAAYYWADFGWTA